MTVDTTISLDVVVTLLLIFGFVRRLDGKISDFRREFDDKLKEFGAELKGDHTALRAELKADNAALRGDLRRVETKVDDGLQGMARLEGRFEGREDRLEAEREGEAG